jgi:hypothetical protein
MHKNVIPIVILHRNEFESLFFMLDSIMAATKIPYRIFVVDNASSVIDREAHFHRLENIPNLKLIRSSRNNWVLGFNEAMRHPDWPADAPYYVFSDADIVLPAVVNGAECWLSYMVQQMSTYACIGKLGFSLRTDDIDNPVLKESVNRQKQRFLGNPRIGSNIIAPVDTTLAIYRTDFFLGRTFEFSVGHASLTRPHYYTCRTAPEVEAMHLGWYQKSSLPLNGALLSEKIRCFAKFGGYIEPEILQRCRSVDRIFYKIVRPLSLLFWGSNVVFSNLRYLISKFPRNVNALQAACR